MLQLLGYLAILRHWFLSKPPGQVFQRWVKPYDASFGGDGVHWGTRGTIYSNYFDVHWGTRALTALSGVNHRSQR